VRPLVGHLLEHRHFRSLDAIGRSLVEADDEDMLRDGRRGVQGTGGVQTYRKTDGKSQATGESFFDHRVEWVQERPGNGFAIGNQ